MQVLRKLQDSGPSLPFREVKPLLEKELGQPTERVFKEIDEEAIAAASLAQVHRGVLRDGREVAVKVQFPFLRVQTPYDLFMIRSTIRLVNRLVEYYEYERIDFLKFYSDFEASLLEELDFNQEAANAAAAASHFEN